MRHGENAFEEFVEVGKAFCSLVESPLKITREKFLEDLYWILPRLIAAGIDLRSGEPDSGQLVSDRVHVEEWSSLHSALQEKLAPTTIYWTVFNPLQEEAPVAGTLADDIADIYRDVKPGLVALELGISRRDIEWEWRFTFEFHRGKHAIEALMVIHQLMNPGT